MMKWKMMKMRRRTNLFFGMLACACIQHFFRRCPVFVRKDMPKKTGESAKEAMP